MKHEKNNKTGEKMKKKSRLSPKPTALITGAASSLGSAISRKLAAQGFNIALHYGKSKFKTLELKKELEEKGAGIILVQANFSDPSQSAQLIHQVVSYWGRLDLVVNNASLFEPTTLSTKDFEKWNHIFN